LDIHVIESRYLEAPRRITVLQTRRRRLSGAVPYPVLYLNDGQNLFDPARAFGGVPWNVQETVRALVRQRAIPHLLVVGIDHGGVLRNREYLPIEDERNPYSRDALGAQYARFVTRELMPFIERHYPVARGAANTGFGGSSYGAIAALYTALVNPGKFGRLLIESPSLYVGDRYLLRQAKLAERWPSRIYVGVGTAETSRADWNEETVANVRRLEEMLRTHGLGPRRLRVVIDEGATHSERAWARRLPGALRFLYG
jgi:predicted alpha/beta superfamily hydrolase